MGSVSDFFPHLLWCYTKILRVQDFTVYQWSCDKLASAALAAYYSVAAHGFKLPSGVSEYRPNSASHHVKNICGQSIRPPLRTETRAFARTQRLVSTLTV